MTDKPKAEVVSLKAVPKEVKQATLQPIDDIVNFFEEKFTLASPLSSPQADMFGYELAIALLRGAGIVDKDGNLEEPYR